MPYNSLVSRTDASALIPEEVSAEILQAVPQSGAVTQLARRLPDMSRAQQRLPVLSALATAYFVDGDTGLKQTSEFNWTNKYIDAAELAVVVPIPETVVADSSYDIWGQIKPHLVEAFGRAIDQAVLYGTNIPSTWTTNLGAAGIVAGANAASQQISAAAYTDLYEAILGETGAGTAGLFGLVEADGYAVTGSIATLAMKSKLRNMRDSDGQPIFVKDVTAGQQYLLDGSPCVFPTNGAISATYWLIAGQWNQLVYSMRQDITYKILTEAVITDAAGAIVYNLAQQDMVALRAVMRIGFALPNPVNPVNTTAATRYPFAVLTA